MICCARCFESLTAPIFIGGKPYGYTCASIIQPGIRKPKVKQEYVLADSFEEEVRNEHKSIFRAKYNGKVYKAYYLRKHFSQGEMQFDGENVYINKNSYKSLR